MCVPLILACSGSMARADPLVSPTALTAGATPARLALVVGQRFTVRLSAQLGAGWSWSLAAPPGDSVRLVAGGTEPSADALDGAANVQVFTFEAVAAGEAQLRFSYRRPWLDDPPRQTVTHVVTVREPARK